MIASRAASGTALVFALGALRSIEAAAQIVTSQYGNARVGATTTEVLLSPRNVSPRSFGKVATLRVDGDVYAQPLVIPRTRVADGSTTPSMLIVAAEAGSVYAFDAGTLAATPMWQRSLLDDRAHAVPVSSQDVLCPFIRPSIGITSTPAIDAARGRIYTLVRSKARGTDGRYRFSQRLHMLDVRTGLDLQPAVEIAAAVPGTGSGARAGQIEFDPLRENPRAGLLLDHGVVYLAWASSCDVGPYHGWIMAYDASSLKQLAVFNTSPDGEAAGVWQGDAGLAADSSGDIYAVTGNGTFTADRGGRDFGNTVLRLRLAAGAFRVIGSFTPSNEAALTREDADLGSSGPVLVAAGNGFPKGFVLVTGKDGKTFLIDGRSMENGARGGKGSSPSTVTTSNGGFAAAAYWNHTAYFWGSDTSLLAYHISGTRLAGPPVAGPVRSADPGAVPVVSANGATDGIVWAIETKTWRGADRAAVLHAFDATDVRRELYSSAMLSSRDGAGLATRFAIPLVADGRVYVGAKGEIDVYGLLAASAR